MNIFTQRRGLLLLAIGFVAGSVLSAQAADLRLVEAATGHRQPAHRHDLLPARAGGLVGNRQRQ